MPSRPKRDLTVDEIVDRAIEITGTDGGESSLTMRALASACGVTPMALYRHVDDKETLLTLIVIPLGCISAGESMRDHRIEPGIPVAAMHDIGSIVTNQAGKPKG